MIVKYPSKNLDQVSIPVLEHLSLPEREELALDMRKECWNVNGLGISAIQINKPFQMFGIINPNKKDLMWICDPHIESYSGFEIFNEGCLSIPDYFWPIKRPKSICISYYDIYGNKHCKTFKGLYARIVQHELDHLDGILIPDFLTEEQREEFLRHFKAKSKISEYNAPEIDMPWDV